ncbi:protein containing Prephenate dehydratase domain protein, partial [gut metagenome]
IVDERIEQCLLGTKEATLNDVKWVYSKDQALWQSKDFLDRLKRRNDRISQYRHGCSICGQSKR